MPRSRTNTKKTTKKQQKRNVAKTEEEEEEPVKETHVARRKTTRRACTTKSKSYVDTDSGNETDLTQESVGSDGNGEEVVTKTSTTKKKKSNNKKRKKSDDTKDGTKKSKKVTITIPVKNNESPSNPSLCGSRPEEMEEAQEDWRDHRGVDYMW